MPLVARAVAVYAAGLLLGFSPHLWFAAALALAGVVWGIHAQRTSVIGLGLLLLGGAWMARATADADRVCAARLSRRNALSVVLVGDAAPGAFVRAQAVDCYAELSLAVERGTAPAGSRVQVRGSIGRSNRGFIVQHAELGTPRPGPWLRRWRAAATRRVNLLFGADAPLARALLVADRSGIPSAMRNRYAAAGIAHMLSISGLHVALIAMAVELALTVLRVPRRRAGLITLGVVAAYVAMLGAPSPALRAAVMLGMVVLSRRWQRPTSPWAILAVGAALPLVDPRAVTGVGYQLSVGGVAALIAAARLVRRWRWLASRRGVARAVATTLLASTMATVVTAPLVAWNFGRLSLVGPITNVVAGPIMALAQPMMFVALALSPVPAVARWFADGAHPLLRAFDFVASTAAVVPGGAIAVAPSAATVCLGIVFVVALISACVSRFPGRSMVTAAGALALMACVPLAPGSTPATELHMIDVGQGNAFALRTRGGHWVLFNAGRAWKGGDDGRSTIVPYIAHRGGSLSAFVLSNARSDNVGGALSVLSALHPRVLMDGVSGRGAAPYLTALRAARGVGIAFRSIRAGDSLVVDEATIRFLAPAVGQHAAASNVVALVQVGAVRILLMGDATQSDERRLLADEPDFLAADVLQVARHGGAAATSAEFLHAVSPVIALVSVGTMGSYGDPSPAVMRRLAARGVDVLRTDRLSTVIVSTDGRSLAVTADGDRWEVPTAHRPLRDEF